VIEPRPVASPPVAESAHAFVATAQGLGRLRDSTVEILDLPFADLGDALRTFGSLDAIGSANVRAVRRLADVELRSPLRPGAIWIVGLNYRSRAERTGRPLPTEPIIHLKASSSIAGSGHRVRLPRSVERLDYEGEIALIIGRRGSAIAEEDAWNHVAGVTAALDLTARDVMAATSNPSLAKSYEGFAPLGGSVLPLHGPAEFERLELRTEVNGELRQKATVGELIFGVPQLISWISGFCVLEPGDVILTGSPAGTGDDIGQWLQPGDLVSVSVSGVLRLDVIVDDGRPVLESNFDERHGRTARPGHGFVLTGGTVIDPANRRLGKADVIVEGGRIVAVGRDLARDGLEPIDCTGGWVVPGLIDAHSHIFPYVSMVGAPPDEAHLRRGVVAAADAGSVGASTFAAFKRFVVEQATLRVLSFLNVSTLGLIDIRFGELLNPRTLSLDDAVAIVREYPDIVRGLKVRLSHDVVGDRCVELLERSLEVAEVAGVPLMAHIGETAAPLSEVLDRMRPGDIIAHCYTGKEPTLLDGNGGVLHAATAARERGVLFDSAHGKTNFSFRVARQAIGDGFLPDIISSDTSARNWRGPVFDLVTTMSKFLALGVELPDIVARTTTAPARLLGLASDGYGAIDVGTPARLTVLRETDETDLQDGANIQLRGRRLEPMVTVLGDITVRPVPWRGLA